MSEAFMVIFQNLERTMTFQKILKGQTKPLSLESGKRKIQGIINYSAYVQFLKQYWKKLRILET